MSKFFIMKKILLRATVLLTIPVVLSQCSKSNANNNGGGGSAGTGNTININGMSFSPATKTVAKGSVVKWQNNDGNVHTATSNDGVTFDTGIISAGGTGTYTASTAGTFAYHCTVHGLTMAGTLIVTP